MNTLNSTAAEIMGKYNVHACTDVTGFGLLGHAFEMIDGSGSGMERDFPRVPVFDEALEYAGSAHPQGHTEREIQEGVVDSRGTWVTLKILFDPDRADCHFCAGGVLGHCWKSCVQRDRRGFYHR